MRKTVIATLATLLCLSLAALPALAAEDGAALYKAKCAACHGPDGAKTAIAKKTVRPLGSPEIQKMTDEELTEMILTGGKTKVATHSFGTKGITPEKAKAIVAHIRTLKK